MFDRQSLTSLLTLLAGVAAAVLVIALQPGPPVEVDVPHACTAGVAARPGQPVCRLASVAPHDRSTP